MKTSRAMGQGPLEISGLSENSKTACKGDLFFCLPGAKVDGRDFAREAVAKGASWVVVEKKPIPGLKAPQVVVPNGRAALALAAKAFYQNPSKKIRVIGVTGTKGKTTTSYLIRHLLEGAGEKSGLIGTIAYQVGNKTYEAPNTTPSSLVVNRLLSEMEAQGCTHAVMEVSSHALAQKRVLGLEFRGAVFTNLGRDHLDFHKTFPNYFKAKKILFNGFPSVRARTVNADDPYGRKLLRSLGRKGVGFGVRTQCRYQAQRVQLHPGKSTFFLQDREFEVPLTGLFNVYNSLAALSVLKEMGFSWEALQEGLRQAPPVPGRFEKVAGGQDFTVLVDYAHTSDALEQALLASREILQQTTGKRLISVFGCGGDRDKTKRPLMGKISAELADLTVVTSDNPRTENPQAILRDILAGIPKGLAGGVEGKVLVEEDRGAAIRLALSKARPGDLVLIAGKGHETYQIFGDRKQHFDDREEARKALNVLRNFRKKEN
jgi:UDP-N-acetylmuramoyl-L-alanyl-D-glutamate--2,6-diaminopimelate ligase